MKKSFVAMGSYYTSKEYGLVRTVCRGRDITDGSEKIAFVKVLSGGMASEIFFMEENEFKESFSS